MGIFHYAKKRIQLTEMNNISCWKSDKGRLYKCDWSSLSRTWRKIWLSDRINRQLLTITTHYSGNKWWELRNLSVRGCNYPDILLKFSPTIHKELNLRSLSHGAIVVEEHFQWYAMSLLEFPGATNHACLPLQFNSAMLNLIRCI